MNLFAHHTGTVFTYALNVPVPVFVPVFVPVRTVFYVVRVRITVCTGILYSIGAEFPE